MHREKFPERIPFRLTRMLVNAMEVSEGSRARIYLLSDYLGFRVWLEPLNMRKGEHLFQVPLFFLFCPFRGENHDRLLPMSGHHVFLQDFVMCCGDKMTGLS